MAMSIGGWLELLNGQAVYPPAILDPRGLERGVRAWIAHCLACHVPVVWIFRALFINEIFCISGRSGWPWLRYATYFTDIFR
jgi:hypothetical protein